MSLKRFIAATVSSFALLAIASPTLDAQDPSLYTQAEPGIIFSGGAQYLVMNRDSNLSSNKQILNGPDSESVGFQNIDFDYKSGIRGFLAAEASGIRIEGIYSNYGNWQAVNHGPLTQGLAFDNGIAGPWAGANSLSQSTYFSSLAVASTPMLGGESDEFEGLGPNTGFPGDALPTFRTWYGSQLQAIEFNVLTADPTSLIQFGIGYSNFQLSERAGTEISGAFRAADVLAPNNGLSHASLTGAGLSFLGGVPDGFQDENGNASGFPDTLTLFNEARTSNNLNGVQAILQQEIMYYRGIVVSGVFKAGLYHNDASGTVVERYTGVDPIPGGATSSYGRSLSDSKSEVAFAGTVGLQSTVPLSHHWSLIGGYEATFIHGVALAPDQTLNGTGTAYSINTNGDLIVHGANAGLLFTY